MPSTLASTPTDAQPTGTRPRGRLPVALLIGAVVGALLGLLLAPGAAAPGEWRGDPGLSARLTDSLRAERGIYSMSVAELDTGQVRRADLGPVGGHHELGSITKTFNGQLFADAITRGEVRPDDRLAQHLPQLAGTPVGEVTLAELASHRAGLPSLLPGEMLGGLLQPFTLRNPYHASTGELIAAAGQVTPGRRGEYAYSNLGAALLGHALARAGGQPDWETLVRQRLLQPLGMTGVVFASRPDLVPADGSTGHTANGNEPEYWTAEGMLPAGVSTWVTVDDLVAYARALLDGTAPGMAALDPQWPAGGKTSRIGYLWQTRSVPGQPVITWHNGRTGSATTFLGLDRAGHRAVIVLNDSGTPVDSLGVGLLTGAPVKAAPLPWLSLIVLLLAVGAVGMLAWRAVRTRSRLPLIAAALDSLTLLFMAWQFGPWQLVPGLLLTALIGVAVVAAGWGVRRWAGLPLTGRHRVGEWLALGLSILFLAVVGAATLV